MKSASNLKVIQILPRSAVPAPPKTSTNSQFFYSKFSLKIKNFEQFFKNYKNARNYFFRISELRKSSDSQVPRFSSSQVPRERLTFCVVTCVILPDGVFNESTLVFRLRVEEYFLYNLNFYVCLECIYFTT